MMARFEPWLMVHELTVQKPLQISWCSWASKRYSNLQVKSQHDFNLKSNKHQGIFLTFWSTSGWLPVLLISHKMLSMIYREWIRWINDNHLWRNEVLEVNSSLIVVFHSWGNSRDSEKSDFNLNQDPSWLRLWYVVR